MIVTIIGVYCILDAILGLTLVYSAAFEKRIVADGGSLKVQFLVAAELAIASWCFK